MVALFEAFLEDLFVGLLVDGQGVASSRPDVHPRVTVRSYLVARELVMARRSYLNWLPYSETKDRASIFFAGGRPFTLLPQDLEDGLQRCYWIRNAIAHQSRHATEVFLQNVIGPKKLIPRERTPPGYLRSVHIALPPPPLTRYQHNAGVMLMAVRFLAA